MSDTIGSLIDKLNTVDFKLWNNNEIIYKIRKMSFDDFKKEYMDSEEKKRYLWEQLNLVCDLNCQRNILIDEIDIKIIDIVMKAISGEDIENGQFMQKKYKTY